MTRKCIYTGLDADKKDTLLERDFFGDNELHNWTGTVPISKEYRAVKKNRPPTEIEARAHEIFYKMELSRLHLRRLEVEQSEIWAELITKVIIDNTPTQKDIEIDQAIHENEVIMEVEEIINKKLKKKASSVWE